MDVYNIAALTNTCVNDESIVEVIKTDKMIYSLEHVVIMGATENNQFQGYTRDMKRITTSLERYNDQLDLNANKVPLVCNPEIAQIIKGFNFPPQYLLCNPKTLDLLLYVTFSAQKLPDDGCVLVYMSGPGYKNRRVKEPGYSLGGVVTRTESIDINSKNARNKGKKGKNVLHPGDLTPANRIPLFLIVESTNSAAFLYYVNIFQQPRVIFMSPKSTPSCLKGVNSLFTQFLEFPLNALCLICNKTNLHERQWIEATQRVKIFMKETAILFSYCKKVDDVFANFYGDRYLRVYILRYVFCYVALRNHISFKNSSYRPKSLPQLPKEILKHRRLNQLFFALVATIKAEKFFKNRSKKYKNSAECSPCRRLSNVTNIDIIDDDFKMDIIENEHESFEISSDESSTQSMLTIIKNKVA